VAANRVERFHRCRLVLSTFYLENRRVLRSLAFGGAGQSLHEIGHAFGKNHSSVRCLVSHHGGFVPAVRRRSLLALSQREREETSRGIASGSSIREIAKCLDRTASTVEGSPVVKTYEVKYATLVARHTPGCYASDSQPTDSHEAALPNISGFLRHIEP